VPQARNVVGELGPRCREKGKKLVGRGFLPTGCRVMGLGAGNFENVAPLDARGIRPGTMNLL